jgi:hypothetical protein
VKLFDLVAKTASDPPVGVNTKQWEYWPSLDGDWLLFGRLYLRSGDREVILFNVATGESQTLAHTVGWNRNLGPGQVSGTFAVWEKAVSKHDTLVSDDVVVYDIASGTRTQIPNPNHRAQYSPSVTSTGTVYYVRSGWGCGVSVKLMSYPVGGSATTVVLLPDGVDVYSTYVVERPDGSTSVFYDPGECGGDSDIYEVNLP